MNKKTKRLFSLLLALVMIMTSIPIVAMPAMAATKQLTTSKFGVCKSRSGYTDSHPEWENRMDDSNPGNATLIWQSKTNDDNNRKYTIAYWIFDISALKIYSLSTVNLRTSVSFSYASGGADFWWIPQDYINEIYIQGPINNTANGTEKYEYVNSDFINNDYSQIESFYDNFKDHYATKTNATKMFTVNHNDSDKDAVNRSIKTAMEAAIAKGDDQFIVAAVRNVSVNDNQGNWSDAAVTKPTIEYDGTLDPNYNNTTINPVNNEGTVTGRVTVGDVIYTSATDDPTRSNDKPQYDYGTYINKTQPYNTPITVNSGTLSRIELVDGENSKVLTTTTVVNETVLDHQDMGAEKFKANTSEDVTATLRFVFTDGKMEYHRVAVKSVPVEAHWAMVAQTWGGSNGYCETAYECYFDGSYGSVDKSTGNPSNKEVYFTGNWDEHRSISNAGTMNGRGGDYYPQWHMREDLGNNNYGAYDKVAGYAIFKDRDNAPATTDVVPTARYYIDKSNLNLANGDLWKGTTTSGHYEIVFPQYRWIRDTSYCTTCYSYTVSLPDGLTASNNNTTGWKKDGNSKFQLANNEVFTNVFSGSSTINADASSTNFEYHVESAEGRAIRPKAKLSINVFDKGTTRTAYNTAVANAKYKDKESTFTASAYAAYLNALLETEAYLSDFENFDNIDAATTTYTTKINDAIDKLDSAKGQRGDVQDIITAANNAYALTTDPNYETTYTTSSRRALDTALSSLTYVSQSGSTFTNNYTGDVREFSKAMANTDIDAINAAVNGLKEVADFGPLETAYEEGDALLKGLNGQDAQYTAASVNELKTALTNAKPYYTYDDASKADTPKEINQENILDPKTRDINNAITGLTAPSVSLDAYNAMKEKVDTYDKDVYALDDTAKAAVKSDLETGVVSTVDYDTATIKVFNDSLDIKAVDNAVTAAMTEMNKYITSYTVSATNASIPENIDIDSNTEGVQVAYGKEVTFTADGNNKDTAWYMRYNSATASRTLQYQGTGATYSTKVFANIEVVAHSKTTTTPNKIVISNKYDRPQPDGIQLIDFVANGSYELPQPTAVPGYAFQNYTVDGQVFTKEQINAGATINITGDTKIVANYSFSAGNYTVTINGTGNDKAYNDSLKLTAADGQVWVQDLGGGKRRLFSNDASTTMFVIENMTLNSVDKNSLTDSDYDNPIYLRSQTMSADGKVIFNGQVAVPEKYKVKEYGVLIGKSKVSDGSFTAADVKVENAGDHDNYKLLRAKSTKTYGTNQFTIRVGNLDMNSVIYKGYIIYEDDKGVINTVYTEEKSN